MNSFQDLELPSALQRALREIHFQNPTPIQAKAIPEALSRNDLIACAQTGTGKTAAFCIPIAVHLLREPQATALILSPTRELAQQIEEFWNRLARYLSGQNAACLIGGVSFSVQAKALSKRPRLLIATPGRLLDHLNQRTARLLQTGLLVLDEADRMLDMGFAPQLTKILHFLPKKRQTLLFSATWDSSLDQLSKKYLTNPARVSVGTISQAAPSVDQKIISTTGNQKNETLLNELNRREGTILVFARTQARTDRLARYLLSRGLEVGRIHGGRSQGQRNSALVAFRNGQTRVLVATDLAARGIDVLKIGHVINYDLPQATEDYIHRIGRTGRAGLKGQALSLLTPEDRSQWNDISNLLRKTGSKIPALENFPSLDRILPGKTVENPR